MIDTETGEIVGYEYHGPLTPPPFIRTPYNYSMERASEETGLACTDPTLAQQHDKDDTDINTLVKRFGITGTMPQLERVPLEGDFHEITDFHSAANAILAAQKTFMTLPADVRSRFDNDPGRFHDFAINGENRAEMEKMGLLKPKAEPPPPLEVRIAKEPEETPGKE